MGNLRKTNTNIQTLIVQGAINYGVEKNIFHKYIKDMGISDKDNFVQTILQVGKGEEYLLVYFIEMG